MLELIKIIELQSRLSCGILAVIFRLILVLFSVKSRLTKREYDDIIHPQSIILSILFPRAPPCNNSPLNERGEHKRGLHQNTRGVRCPDKSGGEKKRGFVSKH